MEHDPHGVCITETWLDDDISDSELFIPGYVTVRLDRSRHGGEIIMYIKSVFSYNVLFTGDSNFECVIVSLKLDSCKFCVCLLYRASQCTWDVSYLVFNLNVNVLSSFFLIGDFIVARCF